VYIEQKKTQSRFKKMYQINNVTFWFRTLKYSSNNNNYKTTNSTQQRSNKIWLSITRELDTIIFTNLRKLHRLF